MLTSVEKTQIRQALQTPQWQTVEKLSHDLCDKLKEDDCIRDTEWDTLKTLLQREGKIRGIRWFIQELYNAAQNE